MEHFDNSDLDFLPTKNVTGRGRAARMALKAKYDQPRGEGKRRMRFDESGRRDRSEAKAKRFSRDWED